MSAMFLGKPEDLDSADQIAQRKIVKIKRHNSKTGEVSVEYP